MIHSSSYWKNHFQTNLVCNRINWNLTPSISPDEKQKILYSLKAWQLGETSEGTQLLAAAGRYAVRHGDGPYMGAIRLFIKEEQKHGNNLGRYIDAIGEKRLKRDWGDSLFRFIRHLNTSMELWTITVIMVEAAAQIFYQSIHDATKCLLLKSICRDILIDEAHHVKFQDERLYLIFREKSFYAKAFSLLFYSILFFGTIHAIWFGHGKAMRAGGVSRKDFMRQMYYKFFKTLKFIHAPHEDERLAGDALLSYLEPLS